jgi:hypothetical protein
LPFLPWLSSFAKKQKRGQIMKLSILLIFAASLWLMGCNSDNNPSGPLAVPPQDGTGGGAGGAAGGQVGAGGQGGNTAQTGVVNINGTWTGQGQGSAGGQAYQCTVVTMQFAQSDTQIALVGGSMTCNGQTFQLQNVVYTIQGNQLLSGNQAIGQISGDSFTIEESGSRSTYQRVGQQLTINETSQDGQFSATLNLQQ